MDYMDRTKYTPAKNIQLGSFQDLQTSDHRSLEKKKHPGKTGAVIAVVVFIAIVSLMTGLLVWHFHYRNKERIQKMYSGSLRIESQTFDNAYENSSSPEFKYMADTVIKDLEILYKKIPQLSKYYVRSTVQAFSEGSIIAYYLSEFKVPVGEVAATDKAMSDLDSKASRTLVSKKNPGTLKIRDIEASSLDSRLFGRVWSRSSEKHWIHLKPNKVMTIQSPGFPNDPYPPNSFIQWELRADYGKAVKLDFKKVDLEKNCSNDFIKVYDSLVAIESRVLEEICGRYAYSEQLTFVSSSNVLFVTMLTNEKDNYPGFEAEVSQVSVPKVIGCGGSLSNNKGSFFSPNFPNYYPPNIECTWNIEVPSNKVVKLTFKPFLVDEPGLKDYINCPKDYVDINGKKHCGENLDGTLVETSTTNTMKVTLRSDNSYVDRGFNATYEAVDGKDPCPNMFACKNKYCIRKELRCDGWDDCGDNTDENSCSSCGNDLFTCKSRLCLSKFWICDGLDDCGDNSDEENCGGCKTGEFTCENNKCVSEKKVCDRNDDCGDKSDEKGCSSGSDCNPSTYLCENKKCISKENPECDGEVDCEDGSDEKNCDCGKKALPASRIVGGQNADKGEFPWQVSLHWDQNGHVCGGSIISRNWVVTAAHCVQGSLGDPKKWKAYLGLHTQRELGSPAMMRPIKQIIDHPYYSARTYDNDIAVMELSSPISYTDRIRPICLPASTHVFEVGKYVWISGWGVEKEGAAVGATVLQKAQVRIINQTTCADVIRNSVTSRMLCAGIMKGGVDACQGDSGGPLSSPVGERMFLAGVVSWGEGCARRNKPGIYTRVTDFRAWIKEKTGV